MDREPNNIFPEIVISPTLQKVGNYLMRKLCLFPEGAPDYMSNHYRPNTGGAEMLDQMTFDYPDKKPDAGL